MSQEDLAGWDYPTSSVMNIEEIQKLHYDRIGAQYESHYGDACSREYRERFIDEPMFQGIDLSGKDVLEAMCGNGQTTEYLLSKGARVTGLDISTAEIDSFRVRFPNCAAMYGSIFETGFADDSFDCVGIVGGLHHLHPDINKAITEIHRVLRPGGWFSFAEPHQGSMPDLIRSRWYKHDKLFASNEASVDLESLKKDFAAEFSFDKEIYLGNLGYLLVLNSMVFRIPVRLKPWYAPAVMAIESVVNRVQGLRTSCFAVSRWRKK